MCLVLCVCASPTQLLSRNPATLREADFFMKEALDLSIPEEHDAIASQHNAFDVSGGGRLQGSV
eukprot:1161938-Pelagomonas_calceolata.AAC.3